MSRPTVSSPNLMKGHQPLDRFCWKMEILSVLSLSMSALHDLAVFVPRVKLWRSISTVPAHKRQEAGGSVTPVKQRADVRDDAQELRTHPGSRRRRASQSPTPAGRGWPEASARFYPERRCSPSSSPPLPEEEEEEGEEVREGE